MEEYTQTGLERGCDWPETIARLNLCRELDNERYRPIFTKEINNHLDYVTFIELDTII